ncbi:sensor histidine kinase [Phenylobacterium aquaticum]|uniref:sensor histidine kinase n=1 Tax=Phenylobacterium aquaticum TaxID=1763816 RepID=UPI001F5D5027|nr:sensor histidine kinase [Phenylobacterium aquaticum]MCI3132455.1 sensor histidine kinase [Phenylobacterium aquaticum]
MSDDRGGRGGDPTSELRHRTANIFQLLGALARMRSQRAGNPEAARQLLWVADAIGSLGALERHRTGGGVDLGGYLNEMTPVWRRRHGAHAAQIEVLAGQVIVPDSMASTLALIAQELIGNALAHGYPNGGPGRIEVGLGPRPDGRTELVVADDGVGFDPAAPANADRFGLWIVRSLATQVRGEFDLATQGGVTARLTFAGLPN